jgi:hypothetical protein
MYDAWVRSGGITGDNNSCVLSSSGDRSNYSTNRCYAVRPALHSTAVNFLKKPRIFRAFGTIVRSYDAWLRSGNESNANKAYIFSSVGSLDGDSTDRRHAVRPALQLNCGKFFLIKPRIFRAFGAVVHIRCLVAFRQ